MNFRIAIATALLATPLLGATSVTAAELEDHSWSNPEFVNSFMGSYGFDTELTPKISSDEQKLFKELVPLMGDNPDLAIQTLKGAITPESSAALNYTLGNLYFQNQHADEALAAYAAAIKKFPNFYRAYKNMALLHVQADRFDEALPCILKAIGLNSGDGTLYGLLGLCYLKQGDYSQALSAYSSAMMLEPRSMDWKKGKLSSLLQLGRYDEAVAMISSLLEKDPSRSELWLMQANAYLGQNKPQEAIVNIELVKDMGKANKASLLLLADMYMNENMPDDAVANYMSVIHEGDFPVGRILRVVDVLVTTGNLDAASKLLSGVEEKSASLDPSLALALLNSKARIAMTRGDDAAATSILEQIIERDPLNGNAHLLLGDLYVKQGDEEKADFEYTYAAKDDKARLKALIQHARLKVSMQDYKSAATFLRQYLNLDNRQNVADFLAQVERAARAQANL